MTDDDRIFALIVVKIWYFTPAGCRWHCVATVQALREGFCPCLIFLWYFYNISKIFLQCFYNISCRQVALCGKSARFDGSFCPCLIFLWYFHNIFAIFLQCFYNISRRQVALCGKSARFEGSFCPCLIFLWYFYNIFAIFLQGFTQTGGVMWQECEVLREGK